VTAFIRDGVQTRPVAVQPKLITVSRTAGNLVDCAGSLLKTMFTA
jgi:hypothetical protein